MNRILRNPLISGLFASIITALILSFIISLIFHFTPISELYLSIASLVAVVFSTFVGGFVGASFAGSRGLVNGIVVGLSFFVLITLLSFLHPEPLTLGSAIKKFVACITSGGLGGIIGISLK
ncbi:MAG: TIGR04086 family membrane protein [Clostridia bacterium]|nr:TIGR04086 family membrane protein [Clostridia bacterium]